MRQIGGENEDPLKRIQQEISEVAQRESELRRIQLEKQSSTSKDNPNDDAMSTTHSDDSGFSTSPSPVNGQSAEESKEKQPTPLNFTSSRAGIPNSAVLVRTMSTPQIFTPNPVRRFNGPAIQKGIMQKFIASRGKIGAVKAMTNSALQNRQQPSSIDINPSSIFIPTNVSTAPIERDSDGRPIRRGYVPVEEKIQKELREMKNREIELKRLRKQVSQRQTNASPSDINYMNDEDYESENEEDDDSYSYDYPPPGKLRATKSIGELCDAINNSSLSPSSQSPFVETRSGGAGGLRPALSLAQLCDLPPEVAPSSHRLIAQWENIIIKKRQEVAA